jgi:hypothetical protein
MCLRGAKQSKEKEGRIPPFHTETNTNGNNLKQLVKEYPPPTKVVDGVNLKILAGVGEEYHIGGNPDNFGPTTIRIRSQ